MEDRSSKTIAIIALVVGIVALSVGFATFTQQLSITNTSSSVNVSSTFSVGFTTSSVTPTTSGSATASAITPGATTITGISPSFTGSGSATYVFTIKNNSSYPAYLKAVNFVGTKSCNTTGVTNPATLNLDTVCGQASMKVKVGTLITEELTSSSTGLTGKSIAAGATETVTVVVSYTSTASVDGAFNVVYPSLTFDLSSSDS